jgi:hypothetical protein
MLPLFVVAVWTDVTKLVADPATLTDDAIVKVLKDYNHEQMAFAPNPKADGTFVCRIHPPPSLLTVAAASHADACACVSALCCLR